MAAKRLFAMHMFILHLRYICFDSHQMFFSRDNKVLLRFFFLFVFLVDYKNCINFNNHITTVLFVSFLFLQGRTEDFFYLFVII